MKFILTEDQYIRFLNKDLNLLKSFLIEKKDEKKADLVSQNVEDFFKTLESIDQPLIQQKKGTFSYEKDVETFQIALILLGFELPVHGVDGLFGPETSRAYKKMIDSGILGKEKTLSETVTEFRPSGGISAGKNVDLRIDSNLQKLIVDIQSQFGLPIKITSAYRSPKKNRQIGGAKNSAHMYHYACDITFSGDREKTLEFARIASKLGALGIGIYRAGVVHIDIDNKKGRRSWGPGFSFSGVPAWAKETLTLHNRGYFSSGQGLNPAGSYSILPDFKIDDETVSTPLSSSTSVVSPETVKMMAKVLREKGVNPSDIQKYTNVGDPNETTNNSEDLKPTDGIIFDKNNDSDEFIIIYGGTPSSQYGASFMKKKMPKNKKTNFIFSDWENTISNVESLLSKKYPKSKITGVVGFSKGGLRAWPAVGKYNFVGLIDPSIEGDYKSHGTSPSGNVIMTYIPKRKWGEKGLNFAIKKLGSRAKEVEGVSHSGMVDDFYTKYIT